jgi:RND family efflux transporter MFP subunit
LVHHQTDRRRRLLLRLGPWALGTVIFSLALLPFVPNVGLVREVESRRPDAPLPAAPRPREHVAASEPSLSAELSARETLASARTGIAPAPTKSPDDLAAQDPLDCVVEPSDLVEVRSSVRGRIKRIPVERGDPVQAGDLLVELDSRVETAAVEAARAQAQMTSEVELRAARVELGESKRNRAKRLYTGDALSADRREEAETEAKVARMELNRARDDKRMAELELRRAEATLEHQSIFSPIAGVVVSRLMTEGEVVDEETILRVAGVERLHVEAILPAELYGSVAEGAAAAVLPLTKERQEHTAHVTIIDPLIDAASSTFGVQLELPNPDRRIPAGVRCQVRFLTASSPIRQ